jgi:hypothetical protein
VDAPAVRRDGDREGLAAGERGERVDLGERAAAEFQAEAGQRHAGDQDVEEQPGRLADDGAAEPVPQRQHMVG